MRSEIEMTFSWRKCIMSRTSRVVRFAVVSFLKTFAAQSEADSCAGSCADGGPGMQRETHTEARGRRQYGRAALLAVGTHS